MSASYRNRANPTRKVQGMRNLKNPRRGNIRRDSETGYYKIKKTNPEKKSPKAVTHRKTKLKLRVF